MARSSEVAEFYTALRQLAGVWSEKQKGSVLINVKKQKKKFLLPNLKRFRQICVEFI